MNLLEVVHPAGRTLVDIAKSQDAEVGDGTTSVVLLAAEILRNCKQFVEEGVHPQIIIKSLWLDFFWEMDVMCLDDLVPLNMIGIKKYIPIAYILIL